MGNFGITFSPPNVNEGEWRFIPTGNKSICYALGAVKGTGQGAIEAIVAERKGQWAVQELLRLLLARGPQAGEQTGGGSLDQKPVRSTPWSRTVRPCWPACLLAFEYADTLAANADQGGLFDFGDSHAASTNEPIWCPPSRGR